MEATNTPTITPTTGATDTVDPFREHLHGMWATVAGSWAEHADYVDARGASVTDAMLGVSVPRPGERVLDLACGPGGAGLAAAKLVGSRGEVVLSDVVAEMTSIAAARAAAIGLTNVTARVLDLERVDEPDGSYDVVLCREGLMFAPEPALAAREIRRVLRPGGRVALAVWGPRDAEPMAGSRPRRGERAARCAGSSAGGAGPLLARRRGPGRRAPVGRRARRRDRHRAPDATSRGVVR